MRVFGFHDGHACGYYRIVLPYRQLAAHGHDVEVHVGWHERAKDYPVVVGQRIGRAEALGLWRRLATPGRRLVWETDDDVWTIDRSNAAAWLTHTPDIIDAIEFSSRMADLVTVSTEPLAEVLRKHNPNVVVLPNHIDAAVLDIDRPHRDKVTIGWAGGDSHLRDFGVIADQLRRFLSRNPHVDYHNIGTSYLRPMRLPGRHTPWQSDPYDYYRAIDFDIGLAPLADTEFNVSKSWIKALEYSALGIPTIASDCPAYRGMVIDGVTGYLVRREHEWARRLYELVNDADARREMGAKAKAHAAQWTIQTGWQLWADAYGSLA